MQGKAMNIGRNPKFFALLLLTLIMQWQATRT